MVEVVGGGESDDPEPGDEGAYSEDPFTDGSVVGGEGGGFAGAEDLATKSNGHEQSAEREGEPSHG